MQRENEKEVIDRISLRHMRLNERLLAKQFERFFGNSQLLMNEDLCRAINVANDRCFSQSKDFLRKLYPKKSPSFVVNKSVRNMTSTPKKLLKESIKLKVMERLQQQDPSILVPTNSAFNQKLHSSTLKSFQKKQNFNRTANRNDLMKFSESEVKEIADMSIIDPPPGFQMPPRSFPNARTPMDTPNNSFENDSVHFDSPNRPYAHIKRAITSTPHRFRGKKFTAVLPSHDQSSIRRVTCDKNLPEEELDSIIEIIESMKTINLDTSNNSISLSSQNIHIIPGKYEIYKILR